MVESNPPREESDCLVIHAGPETVSLRGSEIDRFFQIARTSEPAYPDPLLVARQVKSEQ